MNLIVLTNYIIVWIIIISNNKVANYKSVLQKWNNFNNKFCKVKLKKI